MLPVKRAVLCFKKCPSAHAVLHILTQRYVPTISSTISSTVSEYIHSLQHISSLLKPLNGLPAVTTQNYTCPQAFSADDSTMTTVLNPSCIRLHTGHVLSWPPAPLSPSERNSRKQITSSLPLQQVRPCWWTISRTIHNSVGNFT